MSNDLRDITKQDKIEFGKRLKDLLIEKGMSQSDLASTLGIDRQSVFGWCSGRTFPRISYLEKISNILNVPKSYLLGWNDEGKTVNVRVDSFNRLITYYTMMEKLSEESKQSVYNLIRTLYNAENQKGSDFIEES